MSEQGVAGVDPAFALILGDPRNALRPPSTMSLERFRRIADAPMEAVSGPDIFSVIDYAALGAAGQIPLRLYRPSLSADLPVILFIHGGGFVIGSLETHDAMCRMLALRSGAAIVAVSYRLAPETPYPGPLDDCEAALAWLTANATRLGVDAARIAVCGDSAGGNLAVATALRARGSGPRICHLGLLYPVITPRGDSASMQAFGTGYLLTRDVLSWFWSCYLGNDANGASDAGGNGSEVDMLRTNIAGLPPITVLTAEFDPLRDEGEAFATAARTAGVAVVARRYLGMIHGFASLPALSPVAGNALNDLAADLQASFAQVAVANRG